MLKSCASGCLRLVSGRKKIVCTSEWLLLTSVMERPAAKQTWTDQYNYYQDRCTGGERREEGVHQSVKLKSCLSTFSDSISSY